MTNMAYTYLDSPVGRLLLVGHNRGLVRIVFLGGKGSIEPPTSWESSREPFTAAMEQLEAYFQRKLKAFDLPLFPEGTQFQHAVWKELRGIPYGTTVSYREIAGRIGRPKAFRAVGAANGRNPLPIVIPCHRVIGSKGDLIGYTGGVRIKRDLLRLEGVPLCTQVRGSLEVPVVGGGKRISEDVGVETEQINKDGKQMESKSVGK